MVDPPDQSYAVHWNVSTFEQRLPVFGSPLNWENHAKFSQYGRDYIRLWVLHIWTRVAAGKTTCVSRGRDARAIHVAR